MPPKLSLSSVICPSAPFLLPITTRQAFRASQRHLEQWATSCAYATNAKPKSKSTPSKFLQQKKQGDRTNRPIKYTNLGINSGHFEPVYLFRQHISSRDLRKAMELLPSLEGKSIMAPHDTFSITRLLHLEVRQENQDKLKMNMDRYLSYARILAHDIRNGLIPLHHAALMHLISLFKTTEKWQEGIDFWTWCREQDETYIDASVYGAAIELLAYHGSTPLGTLEELYQEGLTRFPGTFAEYHLSPEAIIADRTQPTSVAGLPMVLLQGVLSARLVHGDWRKAYLALDIAFRLYPTQVPNRIYSIFVYERPLSESFAVTMMAMRSGIIITPGHLSSLLRRLNDRNRYNAIQEKFATLHGIISAIHAFIGCGGSLHHKHVSLLIKGFEVLLPDSNGNSQDAEVSRCIVSTVLKIFTDFIEAGVVPMDRAIYGTLISFLGKARSTEVILKTIEEMSNVGIGFDAITMRVTVSAFGEARAAENLESSWKLLVQLANSQGRQVSEADWKTLARATKSTGNVSFLKKQMEDLGHTLTEDIERAINWELDKEPTPQDKNALPKEAEAVAIEMESIHTRARQLLALYKSGSLLDFKLSPTPMFLDSARPALGSIEDLRAVYHELTTDPHQPPPPENSAKPKPLSPTGYSLDELRFQNWVTILEVMNDADAFEAEKSKLIDEAIAFGNPLTDKVHVPLYRKHPLPESSVLYPSREKLRKRVLELRGVHTSQAA